MVRTRVELQEQTEVGDALVRGWCAHSWAWPPTGRSGARSDDDACVAGQRISRLQRRDGFGFRPNWLILAVLSYPAIYGVGRLYIRLAEQGERDFTRIVDAGEEQ